jgi:hypothetical protein
MKRTKENSNSGSIPKEIFFKGSIPEGNLPFLIDVKGEEINQMHGEKEKRHDSKGSM